MLKLIWSRARKEVFLNRIVLSALCAFALELMTGMANAVEPAACLSPDPGQWPASSKPYFLVIVDTSKSMGTTVPTGSNSCGYQHNRLGDARCAVSNMVKAYGGLVNFGLATYAWKLDCPIGTSTCNTCDQTTGCFTNASCVATYSSGDDGSCGPLVSESSLGNLSIHGGAYIAAPLVQDNYWNPSGSTPNVDSLLALADNNCGNGEIGANSNTPLGGTLFNMNQYLSGTYRDPFTTTVLTSPIGPATFGGNPAERTCRSINVILITDGDETCDLYNLGSYPNGEGLAVYEAGRLLSPGVTVSGQTFSVKTHVIGFAGATTAALDHIAAAGGTSASYTTANEAQLFQALSNIIGGTIRAEACDNSDNNCNGCTDEGFTHYANVGSTCCSWSNATQRNTCLTNYKTSITNANPKGDLTLLPCTTASQATDPLTWLCYNPGDGCDNIDNNANGQIDENQSKCGNPTHCPQSEICNGSDDDCDGQADEGGVCGACTPSVEVCDGCDNDCDGTTDNGLAAIACGLTGPGVPPNCAGTLTCKTSQNVAPGSCVAGGGYNACNNSPQAESCDALDNDCNGIVDDNVPSQACTPAELSGLTFGGSSQCQQGHTACISGTSSCQGAVGPSAEVCDGIDNDCDNIVDNGVAAVGHACGTDIGPCQPGAIACVNGALVCQGNVAPQAEVCDGIDNDCDGVTDAPDLCSGGQVCRAGQCVAP